MASRLLHRLKRSFFKDGHEAELPQEEEAETREEEEEDGGGDCEAELEEEEECVTERLGGTLCFDSRGGGGTEDGGEGDRSGLDSDSDFLGESMEEGLSSADTSPVGVSPVGPSSLLARHFQDSWRRLSGASGASTSPTGRRLTDSLLFEVTDASAVQDGSSKYVLYTIHVIQAGGSDKTPAIITRRYSDFRRLHATLCRDHGALMERVCFPRKKLRRNFTAETIAKRSRAFEQYLYHLCSLSVLQRALCVRHFFYLADLQAGQLLIRVERYQDALGPLLNAKRLQNKLGWTSYWDAEAQDRPGDASHWLFTLVGLLICFQEVDQLEDARDHCDHALRVLVPAGSLTGPEQKPSSGPEQVQSPGGAVPLEQHLAKSHPIMVPLLQAIVRLSWQTGKDKRQWEELMQLLEEKGAELDNQPTIKEFLVKYSLEEQEGNC